MLRIAKKNVLCLLAGARALEPEFQMPLRNQSIAQGRDAIFTCVVNNLGGHRVSGWDVVGKPFRLSD
ncbi:Striated muscle-specific serine/threonine-protein kinase [Frankliniella fusca]|uniref:Striated muscle-specific serine/threonine-protein kinase n=1 Tax=Frankliniella fusca TaxID=407009 RepID=A0AAE1HK23_9NEOP|nr:Striated muscle-specific serine/threonine-protein kinase [Frankliniella fusca]